MDVFFVSIPLHPFHSVSNGKNILREDKQEQNKNILMLGSLAHFTSNAWCHLVHQTKPNGSFLQLEFPTQAQGKQPHNF